MPIFSLFFSLGRNQETYWENFTLYQRIFAGSAYRHARQNKKT